MVDLGTLGRDESWASAISNSGQAVGALYRRHRFDPFLCVLVDAEGRDGQISGLGGTYSAAFAVNDSGHVVGESANAAGEMHAVPWQISKH